MNPVTHGNTFEEPVRNGLIVLEDLVAVTQKHGQPLPASQFLDPPLESAGVRSPGLPPARPPIEVRHAARGGGREHAWHVESHTAK